MSPDYLYRCTRCGLVTEEAPRSSCQCGNSVCMRYTSAAVKPEPEPKPQEPREFSAYIVVNVLNWRPGIDEAYALSKRLDFPVRVSYGHRIWLITPDFTPEAIETIKTERFTVGV